jgi:hypothetical protein
MVETDTQGNCNGADITLVTHNYMSEGWDKLRQVGGHTCVYQRREYLSGCTGQGKQGRGGNCGSGCGSSGGQYNKRQIENEPRAFAAVNTTNTTGVVEYSGSTSTISTPSTTTTTSDCGGRSGGHFGPRRD